LVKHRAEEAAVALQFCRYWDLLNHIHAQDSESWFACGQGIPSSKSWAGEVTGVQRPFTTGASMQLLESVVVAVAVI